MSDDKKDKRQKLRRYYNIDEEAFDELKPFEDVIDDVVEEEEKKRRKSHKKEVEKYGESYELYNFLETENQRLNFLDDFFSNKLPNMKQHLQTKALVMKQNETRKNLQQQIVTKMKAKESPLRSYMKDIFDKAFIARGQK